MVKTIDLEKFENLVAEGLSLDKCAAELKINVQTLYKMKRNQSEMRAAYERGLARRPNEKPQPAKQTPEDLVLAAIRQGFNCRGKIKQQTGLPYPQLETILYALTYEKLQINSEHQGSVEYFSIRGEEVKQVEAVIVSDERLAPAHKISARREQPVAQREATLQKSQPAPTPDVSFVPPRNSRSVHPCSGDVCS